LRWLQSRLNSWAEHAHGGRAKEPPEARGQGQRPLLPAKDAPLDLRDPEEEICRHAKHTRKEVTVRHIGVAPRLSEFIRTQAIRHMHSLGQPAGDQLGVELKDFKGDPVTAYTAVAGRANRASQEAEVDRRFIRDGVLPTVHVSVEDVRSFWPRLRRLKPYVPPGFEKRARNGHRVF